MSKTKIDWNKVKEILKKEKDVLDFIEKERDDQNNFINFIKSGGNPEFDLKSINLEYFKKNDSNDLDFEKLFESIPSSKIQKQEHQGEDNKDIPPLENQGEDNKDTPPPEHQGEDKDTPPLENQGEDNKDTPPPLLGKQDNDKEIITTGTY